MWKEFKDIKIGNSFFAVYRGKWTSFKKLDETQAITTMFEVVEFEPNEKVLDLEYKEPDKYV